MYVKCDTVKKLQPVQTYVDTDMELNDAEEVVSVQAKARVDSVTPSQGAADVVTTIDYAVIYNAADGLGSLKDVKVETVRLTAPFINENSFVVAEAGVVSTEFVGTGKLRVRVMLEVSGIALEPSGFESGEVSEDMCLKKESVALIVAEPVRGGEFIIEGGDFVRDAIDEIVFAEPVIKLDSVTSATDITKLSGTLYTYVRYLGAGRAAGYVIRTPFDSELLTPGVTEDSKVYLTPVKIGANVYSTPGETGSELKVEATVGMSGYALNKTETEIVTDAYSRTKETKPEYAVKEVTSDSCAVTEKVKYFGSATVSEDVNLRNIAALGAPAICALGVSGTDPIVVEGVIGAEIICEDDSGKPVRIFAEVPFRAESELSGECPSAVMVSAAVSEYTARLRQGGSTEISGEIEIRIASETRNEISFVESVREIGDKQPDDELVISLYVVGEGEGLFEVAKALNSDEEELKRMNPSMTLPVKTGDKILYYKAE